MTASQRHALKAILDAHTRAETLRPPGTPGFCKECLMPWTTVTPGCVRCRDRARQSATDRRAAKVQWHRHKMATDPAYRERRRLIHLNRRRRARQEATA